MKYCITGISYRTSRGSEIVLSVRDESGRRQSPIVVPFSPYFYYIETQDRIFNLFLSKYPHLRDSIVATERGYRSFDGNRLVKVYVRYPYNVGEINKWLLPFHKNYGYYLHLYESNILFTKRFLIDCNLYTGIEFDGKNFLPVQMPSRHRLLMIDIEVEGEEEWKDNTFKYPVIIVGLYDYSNRNYYQFYVGEKLDIFPEDKDPIFYYNCRDESDLYDRLSEVWKEISPDVVVSFSPFDMHYLYHRIKEIGKDFLFLSPIGIVSKGPHFHCLDVLDYAELYRKVLGERVWHTLGYIGEKELGYGKIDLVDPIHIVWKKDPGAVVRYNYRDVKILKDLEDKLHLVRDYIVPIWNLTGLSFSDCLSPNKIADILHLRDSYGKVVWRSYSYLKPTGYTGALVYAEPGVYDNVLVLDWSELYPSLMETFHISWDTMTKIAGDIKVGNVFFSKDSPGQTNRIIKPLREYRSQIKRAMKETNNREEKSRLKLLSDALKAIINANYGVYGFHSTKGNGSRYYDPDVASAITYIGREIFNQVKTYISSIDYHMVYGDTDSIFLCLKGGEDETSRIVSGIQDHINSFIRDKYNLESKLKIASEYTMKRVIIISKKRYYGITTSGEEIIKGLEIVRMESAPVTVVVEKEVGRLILNDKASEVKDLKNAVVRRILEGKVPLEDIALRSRCTKDLKDYKTKTRNSKAVEVYKHITGKEIKKGERFYLLQILPNQKLRKEMNVKWNVNVVGVKKLSELPKDIQIDYRKMADLTVVSPVEKYIQAIQSKSYKQRNLTEYW